MMPRYSYKCEECEETINVFHSISEKPEKCDCGAVGSLTKILSKPLIAVEKSSVITKKKTGDVVEGSIKEFKESLQEQKEDLAKLAKRNYD